MTDNAPIEKPPVDEVEGDSPVAEVPTPPEPMTPQRVTEWHAYYDIYVAGFVILLAFMSASSKIQTANSGIWSLLQAGRQMAATRAPVVTDTTTIAGLDHRWVNIPWLFELSHYGLYQAAASLAPKPEIEVPVPKATGPREQYGIGALIALDALIRGLTALLLLGLRRKGPGLWWSAVCVTLALGATLAPTPSPTGEMTIGVQIGGIALPASVVSPETWGLFLLAIELLLLHQAINLGKVGRLYGMIPLFLLWANVDESFAFGLIALAASVVGLLIDARRGGSSSTVRTGLIVLGLGFAATMVNPSHVHAVAAAFAPFWRAFGLEFGPPAVRPLFLFGSTFTASFGPAVARALWLYYGVLVGLGLVSFLVNRDHFVVSRFLMFVVGAVSWALGFNAFTAVFSLILVATLCWNGQEWYHRTFGTEGRLGGGWRLWSTGGRLLTIALTFAAIARGITGWGGQEGDFQFGFGFNPDEFPFESAEALKDAPIEGVILNTSLAQGDVIAWKALSKRKAFLDSRQHLYPNLVFEEWRELRLALKDDDIAKWQPILDRYKISAVLTQMRSDSREKAAPLTYAKLMKSPNWIPFYDDGAIVMFGRADSKAPASDLSYFRANKLDSDEMAYKRPKRVPLWERPPTPTWDLVDRIFQNRLLSRPQPHDDSALRWLQPSSEASALPDPARCLMAIREARVALSYKPDDTVAFQILAEAYRILLAEESAIILGVPLTPENLAKISQEPPQSRVLVNRARQLLTVLNFRVETLPPSKGVDDQKVKADLNFRMARLYLQMNAFDLARDRLARVAEDARTSGLNTEFLKSLTNQLTELNQRIEQIQSQMSELAINQKLSPMDKANFARSRGVPGLAIHELEEANDAGAPIPGVRAMLVDLYCETGQPDKALDIIATLKNVDDPMLATGIGTSTYRQGSVYLLLGNYENAVDLWQNRSIAQVRTQRSLEAPLATQRLLSGDPIASTKILMQLPENVDTQAQWEFELAMAALEGGIPSDIVADHFQNALKLEPSLTVRPLIAYYLGKMGKPVPPPKAPPAKSAEPPTAPPTTPTPPPPTTTPSTLPTVEKPELPAIPFAPDPTPTPTTPPTKP